MPSESAYVFAAHSAQGPPGGPKKPRPHRQSVCASLRGGSCEFTEQASHAAVQGPTAGHCRHSLYARRCAGEPPSALHSPHTPPCQACQRRCSPRIQCTPRRSARRTRDDNGSL